MKGGRGGWRARYRDAGWKDAERYYKGYIKWLEESLSDQIKGRVSTGTLLGSDPSLLSARAERFDTLPLNKEGVC